MFKRRPGLRAFTLIELLVVISIIGILATLVLGVAPMVSKKMKLNRVQAELSQLESAIESYKSAIGTYPPDNVLRRNPLQIEPATNQLFYELTGTIYDPQNNLFRSKSRNEQVGVADIKRFFNRDGFANSANMGSDEEARNFLPNLRAAQFAEISSSPDVEVLVVPVDGPQGSLNPWRYVSTEPTNNPSTFDLWAEIVIGGETNIIANWKE